MATTSSTPDTAAKPSRLQGISDGFKSLAEAIKATFFSLLLLLLFIPPVTKRLLSAYGLQISEVSSKDGIVLKQLEQSQKDAKEAGTAIASNQQQLPQVKDTLQSVLGQVKDARVKQQVSTALAQVDQAVAYNATAVSSVGSAIVNQSQAYQAVSTSSTRSGDVPAESSEGWLYLGRVDAAKKVWLDNGPLSIFFVPLPINPGQTLVLAGTALIRGDAESGKHANAAVVGALPKNTKLIVESVDPSHALNGDYFIWVRVKAQS